MSSMRKKGTSGEIDWFTWKTWIISDLRHLYNRQKETWQNTDESGHHGAKEMMWMLKTLIKLVNILLS